MLLILLICQALIIAKESFTVLRACRSFPGGPWRLACDNMSLGDINFCDLWHHTYVSTVIYWKILHESTSQFWVMLHFDLTKTFFVLSLKGTRLIDHVDVSRSKFQVHLRLTFSYVFNALVMKELTLRSKIWGFFMEFKDLSERNLDLATLSLSFFRPLRRRAFLILCMSCSLCCSPVHKESASGKSAPAFNSYVWLYQCRWNGCEVFGGITGRATTFACKSQECQWAGLV